MSTYISFWHCLSAFPTPETPWPRETQRTKQRSSNAREEKIHFFSLPLPIAPPAFLSSKSKAAFTKSLQKQAASSASCRNVTSLVSSYSALQKNVHHFRQPERKTISLDHLSQGHRIVAGPAWANSAAECPSVAPGNAGQKGGVCFTKKGGYTAKLQRLCLKTENLQPYAGLVTVFWFQGTFHLCQDKLMSLIPTAFIKDFHIIGNGQAENISSGEKRQPLNSTQTGEDTEPNPELKCSGLAPEDSKSRDLVSIKQAGDPLTQAAHPLSRTYGRWRQVGSRRAAGGTTGAWTGIRRHWHRSS